jgi:hypothetical protein
MAIPPPTISKTGITLIEAAPREFPVWVMAIACCDPISLRRANAALI